MASLLAPGVTARASSVLKRNTPLYGPKNVLDGSDETCWNSDQGLPQWIELAFPAPIAPAAVILAFQGGFVGQDCDIEAVLPGGSSDAPGARVRVAHIEPDDVNSQQVFAVADAMPAGGVAALRFTFGKSTDFYGRVTIYSIDLLG